MIKEIFTKQVADAFSRENFLRIKYYLELFQTQFDTLSVPRYTSDIRDTITPRTGMIIFNETTSKFQGYTGSGWDDLN